MNPKKYSLKTILTRNLILLLIMALISLLLFGLFSYQAGIHQLEESSTAVRNVYATTLQNEMGKLSDFTKNMCYNDTAYHLLSTNYYSSSEKITYEYTLRKMLKSELTPYSALLVFSDTAATSMYEFGSFFPAATYAKHFYDFKEDLKTYWLTAPISEQETWQTYSNDYFSVIMYACQYNNLFLVSLIDLNFFSHKEYDLGEDATSICFFNDTALLSNQEEMTSLGVDYDDLASGAITSWRRPAVLTKAAISNSPVFIACYMAVDYFSGYFRASLLCICGMFFAFGVLFLIMFRSFRRFLSYPVTQIVAATDSLGQNNTADFLAHSQSNIIEFQKINSALFELINQKMALEKENQLERDEKNHAMLQYFQLQARSHFFINCLKSLYNMLAMKEYEKMQRMILAFSNHLRYVFRDNLKLVTLKEEMQEVNDYYNIILMDHSNPILLITKIDETLMDFSVPPLLIQTFLENSIKHNAQSEKLLCFTVQIDRSFLEDRPIVFIKLTDNGTGYTPDMLNKLNCMENDLYENYHVGISNLKKRVQLIYKSDFQFTFYNEPAGGAVTLIYLPLEEL